MAVDITDPEDKKLVVLARATRARTGAAAGAALRDLDGRTYAGATVDLPSLRVSALGVCIAMAVASGAKGAEAVVVLGDGQPGPEDLAALLEFAGPGVPAHVGTPNGAIAATLTS
ncbi:cytidine deaminase [Nocardioides marmoriginsengisoli]|uniref:Cytidine deaminase n=1 Tax=Nocardioides marmoriginsengisoli TaxID=661483 RepID=A0A3N0CK40_9ACTN|nr:cytidine deaminase [Nocardioides marmoriginsengisoli]RNL63709.1 cytidine deaminase [Nocardioides marmoriginsengisoli]